MEVFGYLVEVLEGEFAFVELSVAEYVVYEPVHKALNPGRSGFGEASAGGFDDVGKHH